MSDHDHWLWRLSAQAWLDAANQELAQADLHLGSRRTAITHARRAAGMALNGVLVSMAEQKWSREQCETAWGRSYIDHLRTLAAASKSDTKEFREPFDAPQFERCRALLGIAVIPPTDVVRLSIRKDEPANEAIRIASEITRTCASVIGS